MSDCGATIRQRPGPAGDTAPVAGWRPALAVIGLTGVLLAGGQAGAAARRPAVPPTFVGVETSAFPEPGAACRDSRRTLRVPSQRFPTISGALSAARPGTRIVVAPGRYREHPNEWFALRLDVSRVCLVAPKRRSSIVAAPGQKYGLLVTGSNVAVSGLTLRGFTASVSLGRDDGATQRAVTLQHLRIVAATAGWSEGIVAYPDHRDRPWVPVVDGLLLADVRLSGVAMGVSCNGGPCAHWWLDRVRIAARGGAGDSGADAFAVESGRQIVVTRSVFSGAGGDGIDTKAEDVVVAGCSVTDVARNGIKLWHGGEVMETTVAGSGADAALVGDGGGRYRYRRISVTDHAPGTDGYVGAWGYDTQQGIQLTITDSTFSHNSAGGLYVPDVPGTTLRLDDDVFADDGAKLLDYGGLELRISLAGLAELQARGWGSGNRLSPRSVSAAG
jgi:hypothetical protein